MCVISPQRRAMNYFRPRDPYLRAGLIGMQKQDTVHLLNGAGLALRGHKPL